MPTWLGLLKKTQLQVIQSLQYKKITRLVYTVQLIQALPIGGILQVE